MRSSLSNFNVLSVASSWLSVKEKRPSVIILARLAPCESATDLDVERSGRLRVGGEGHDLLVQHSHAQRRAHPLRRVAARALEDAAHATGGVPHLRRRGGHWEKGRTQKNEKQKFRTYTHSNIYSTSSACKRTHRNEGRETTSEGEGAPVPHIPSHARQNPVRGRRPHLLDARLVLDDDRVLEVRRRARVLHVASAARARHHHKLVLTPARSWCHVTALRVAIVTLGVEGEGEIESTLPCGWNGLIIIIIYS